MTKPTRYESLLADIPAYLPLQFCDITSAKQLSHPLFQIDYLLYFILIALHSLLNYISKLPTQNNTDCIYVK